MTRETYAEIAHRNYMRVFILLIFVAFLGRSLGNSNELLLLKLAVVPLFFLSLGGLRSLYRYPIVAYQITFRAVEYTVLDGLLYSLFTSVVLWTSGDGVADLLIRFGFLVASFTTLKLVFLFLNVRLHARLKDNFGINYLEEK